MPEAAPPPPPVPVVYAHSADTLYLLDPTSDQVTVVGPFQGCTQSFETQVVDLALDQNSNAYVTTGDGLYKVDLTSAACTLIAPGSYPNSLSFVPKGTVDPAAEALVGYMGSQYVRVDPTTGAVTNIGVGLSDGYTSSGDIVSVAGGGTFLTVKGGPESCGDCLLQVDPTTGALIKDYGSVNHADVFGLAFWAGTRRSLLDRLRRRHARHDGHPGTQPALGALVLGRGFDDGGASHVGRRRRDPDRAVSAACGLAQGSPPPAAVLA